MIPSLADLPPGEKPKVTTGMVKTWLLNAKSKLNDKKVRLTPILSV